MAGLESGVRPVTAQGLVARTLRAGRTMAARVRPLARLIARRPRLTLGVIAVLAAVLVGSSVTAWVAVDRHNEVESAEERATKSAEAAVSALLSYNFGSVSSAPAAQASRMTGTFKSEYTALVKDQIAPVAKRRELVTRTEVVSTATVSADPDRVVLLLFLNQVSQGKDSKGPVLNGSRARVTMEKVSDSWRVADLEAL